MTDNLLKSHAFKLKGRLYTFTVIQLLSTDNTLFLNQLKELIEKAPRLFDNTPVVLDFSQLQSESIELEAFCKTLREHNLFPVGVQGADPLLSTLAQCNGLAVLHASTNHDKPIHDDQPEEPHHQESLKTKLLTTPVRSGQQVVSKGGDLIITASVSHGAELLADGNIHVYGTLRGRALAGISGDKNARIFCQALDADLVSIAGFYRLSDAIEPSSTPCQIYLQDEHIHIEPLC
ncbi:septum site determining protein MinC [Legionella birminghamensis]|uniref:Probable septum site-determining protein MinC n=1 Tax=Legionella birminghamensis TaxID=28083 RepID=A0A378IAP9_9GAMM|nr:septum site-determining protein MinC [Legionella birminghamensis]KTC69368.1 septum site determining protein MinC [Legionella birminghamensis]STX31631.1 septum site determining protein MinC [Legionella birminghamensis]